MQECELQFGRGSALRLVRLERLARLSVSLEVCPLEVDELERLPQLNAKGVIARLEFSEAVLGLCELGTRDLASLA
jgi:hypothetical protein